MTKFRILINLRPASVRNVLIHAGFDRGSWKCRLQLLTSPGDRSMSTTVHRRSRRDKGATLYMELIARFPLRPSARIATSSKPPPSPMPYQSATT